MSQENVETVRKVFEASDLRATVEWLDPDVEWWDRGDEPTPTIHRGHDAVLAYLNELDAFIADFDVEPKEFIDAGEYVVAVVRMRTKGLGSGIELNRQDAVVYRCDHGKISRVDYYNNKEQALEAAGLSE